MRNHIFRPAEILLPDVSDLRKWSVVACDQFTSDAEYWQEAERFVGDAPSALRLMLPEAYLGHCDEAACTRKIQQTMRDYLTGGVFRALEQSFVYLERRLPDGHLRRGLVGMIDLEAYDYHPDSVSPVRATEGTVEERLPPRVRVRAAAALEMPHIMLFLNDPQDRVMQGAAAQNGEVVYDFDLMGGGGHIIGRRISGAAAEETADLVAAVTDNQAVKFAVGDGNHSLAAARNCWLEKKQRLSLDEAAKDPARYALVELVNIHADAICFEPIHRVLFQTNTAQWFSAAERQLADAQGREIVLLTGGERRTIRAKGDTIGDLIANVERFCRDYLAQYGGEIDYIHGADETRLLSAQPDACGVLLPPIDKNELFSSIERSGPFPRKSFSIGLGSDKRYYLECRKI